MMQANKNLVPGDVVAGLEPAELVEVQRVAPFGSKTLVDGVGLRSRREVNRPLAAAELAAFVKVRGQQRLLDGDAQFFLLGAEAERVRIAHQFAPRFAVNSNMGNPPCHQLESGYRYRMSLPRIRFILAHDTGAGKTIMTGLPIKELLFRGVIQKIFVMTPGRSTKQWNEEELQEKFGLRTRLMYRASFEAEPGQFCRYAEGSFVPSIDWLAWNESCLKATSETQWSVVVVDEAHKLLTQEYGTKLKKSELPISNACNRFFLRRPKEDMVDGDRQPLFKSRHTGTVGYDLTPEKKILYDEVTRYVRSMRKESEAKKNRNIVLTLLVMQRGLASSPCAITRTLENRLRTLDEALSVPRNRRRSEAKKKRLLRGTPYSSAPRDITESEDLTEEECERIDRRISGQVLTDDPDEVVEERVEVEPLFRLADSVNCHAVAKFAELLAVLDSSDVIWAEDETLPNVTEHRHTLCLYPPGIEVLGACLYSGTRRQGSAAGRRARLVEGPP